MFFNQFESSKALIAVSCRAGRGGRQVYHTSDTHTLKFLSKEVLFKENSDCKYMLRRARYNQFVMGLMQETFLESFFSIAIIEPYCSTIPFMNLSFDFVYSLYKKNAVCAHFRYFYNLLNLFAVNLFVAFSYLGRTILHFNTLLV